MLNSSEKIFGSASNSKDNIIIYGKMRLHLPRSSSNFPQFWRQITVFPTLPFFVNWSLSWVSNAKWTNISWKNESIKKPFNFQAPVFHRTQLDVLLSVWRKCEYTQLQPSKMYKPADRKYSYFHTRQIWKGGLNYRKKSRDYHHS